MDARQNTHTHTHTSTRAPTPAHTPTRASAHTFLVYNFFQGLRFVPESIFVPLLVLCEKFKKNDKLKFKMKESRTKCKANTENYVSYVRMIVFVPYTLIKKTVFNDFVTNIGRALTLL